MEPFLSSPSPVSPLVDLLPLSLRPDSTTVTEGIETVLDDPKTAQYTHTLSVTTGGEYTCTVANAAFSAFESITVQGSLTETLESVIISSLSFSRSLTSQWCDSSPGWSH